MFESFLTKTQKQTAEQPTAFAHSQCSELAQEFGVSEALMRRFIEAFSPNFVPENYYYETADTMLFIHIPKTAGVSVGRSFKESFDVFYSIKWDNIPNSFRAETRQAIYCQTQGNRRQVIMGHFGWPEMQIWRNHEMPMKCGTIFRDPVTRAISNYNYNCSTAHPAHESFRDKFPTLDSYIQKMPIDVQLTQAIGLVNSFENALTKLTNYYTFLGVTEHLSASLAHLRRTHGLPDLKEYRENVGKKTAGQEALGKQRQAIEDRSYNDLKIHKLLMRIYGAS